MAQPAVNSSRRFSLRIVIAFVLVVVGGAGTWLYVDSARGVGGCKAFLDDKRVRAALGVEYEPDLSCAELGAAIKRVTTGPTTGKHSLKQARSMQNLLAAMDDWTSGRDGGVDTDLAVPFSEALADYSADTYQILSSVNVDYIRRDASSTSPWQDGDGVHMSVSQESMLRVMRALSESPVAYATARESITQDVAAQFAETPRTAGKDRLSLVTKLSARVLGALDAVAEKAEAASGDRKRWDGEVITHLTQNAVEIPPYAKDPVGHLVQTWKQKLRTNADGESVFTSLLESQSTEMTNSWSAGLGLGHDLSSSLMDDSRDSAYSGRSAALRQLE